MQNIQFKSNLSKLMSYFLLIMLEANNQVQFEPVSFFTITHSHTDLPDHISTHSIYNKIDEKEDKIQYQESTDPQIFISDQEQQHQQIYDKKMKRNSTLHNLQKHLFTFLQFLISNEDLHDNFNHLGDDISNCVRKIFELVKRQKRKTKQDLMPIFGKFNFNKISQKNKGYKQLFKDYPINILQRSLQYVRKCLMFRIENNVLMEYLQNSKMEKKSEFIQYVDIFVEEVRESRFGSRMTKKSQDLIRERMKDELEVEEWANVIA